MTSNEPRLLAVVYRSPYLATALAEGSRLLELRRFRIRESEDFFKKLRAHIAREAAAYRVSSIIIEPKRVTEAAAKSLDLPHRTLTYREAQRIILEEMPHDDVATGRYFDHLLHLHKELRRFVRVLPTRRKRRSRRKMSTFGRTLREIR